MRLEIKVRNSQDNKPIPGAKVTVYYTHKSSAKGGFGALTKTVYLARNKMVKANGKISMEVPEVTTYNIRISAEGFLETNPHYIMKSAKCDHIKPVTMSPILLPGQTRIMMTWEQAHPKDLDIRVVSIRKSDKKTCRTFYGHKTGCPAISLDLDNTKGGPNGAETLTLLDNNVNKDYTYVIGVEDYGFESRGAKFLDSGCEIRITNGIKGKEKEKMMVAESVTKAEE